MAMTKKHSKKRGSPKAQLTWILSAALSLQTLCVTAVTYVCGGNISEPIILNEYPEVGCFDLTEGVTDDPWAGGADLTDLCEIIYGPD